MLDYPHMSQEKTTRNRKITDLRKSNAAKWSYRKLARKFKLDYTTVRNIIKRGEDPTA